MKTTSFLSFKIILVLKRKKVKEITFVLESNSVVFLPRNYNHSF